MKKVTLIGRNSKLSIVQLQLVKQKIEQLNGNYFVDIITKTSTGDTLKDVPLHTVEGSDFFTKDIYQALENKEADIAVHSLKDMSFEHFNSNHAFAVVDRNDTRDVAIFNNNIIEKIRRGETIIVGTCSPRRELMATAFLKKALPQLHNHITIVTKPIRGNVETRLQKLDSGLYDATILATAGINRLLATIENTNLLQPLLANKKLMLLPLFECTPAPCQGAIVAEANNNNTIAVSIINAINNTSLYTDCIEEKLIAQQYGSGCNQPFGVTTIQTHQNKYLFAAGNNKDGEAFEWFSHLPSIKPNCLFSSTNFMKNFFSYEWSNNTTTIHSKVVYVANYKAIKNNIVIPNEPIITASGTRTWFELAKQGYWVTANADAIGFEQMVTTLQMPLFNYNKEDYTIVTNIESATRWKHKNYTAVGSYHLIPLHNNTIQAAIAKADMVFWTSYLQFHYYKKYCTPTVIHSCTSGETAQQLQQQGIEPIIFPTIKAFQLWKQYNTL